MKSIKKIRGLNLALGFAILASGTAYAQQQPGLPSTGQPPVSNRDMYKERTDNLNELDYDREREEVKKKDTRPRSADGRELKLSRKEQQTIAAIEAALAKKDYAKAAQLIGAGQKAAQTPDAKYAMGAKQLQLGYDTQNQALQDQGVEAALASGVAPANLLPQLYRHQGVAALQAGDFAKAETALAKLAELAPQDADAVVLLAETKNRAKKPAEALPLFQKAVALKKASGEAVPPAWVRAVEVMTAMVKARGSRQ